MYLVLSEIVNKMEDNIGINDIEFISIGYWFKVIKNNIKQIHTTGDVLNFMFSCYPEIDIQYLAKLSGGDYTTLYGAMMDHYQSTDKQKVDKIIQLNLKLLSKQDINNLNKRVKIYTFIILILILLWLVILNIIRVKN